MTSLKQILLQFVQAVGKMSSFELESICREEGYKLSNGERRMRELVNEGKVIALRNEKHVVTGYKLKTNIEHIWLTDI